MNRTPDGNGGHNMRRALERVAQRSSLQADSCQFVVNIHKGGKKKAKQSRQPFLSVDVITDGRFSDINCDHPALVFFL